MNAMRKWNGLGLGFAMAALATLVGGCEIVLQARHDGDTGGGGGTGGASSASSSQASSSQASSTHASSSTSGTGGASTSTASSGSGGAAPGCTPATCGAAQWSKAYGDGSSLAGMATDASGNIYLAGSFAASVDFGGGALTSAGTQNVFVAKTFCVRALTSAGTQNVFVAKLDPTGKQLWAQRFGDATTQTAHALAVGPNGEVAVVGGFVGTMTVGTKTLSLGTGDTGAGFVFKLATNGTPVRARAFQNADPSPTLPYNAFGVAIDGGGNVVVSGVFAGPINLGSGVITPAGTYSGFLVQLSGQTGSTNWSKAIGDASTSVLLSGVATDSSQSVVLLGSFSGTGPLELGGTSLTTPGGFLVKYNSSGDWVWDHPLSAATSLAFAPAVDPLTQDVLVAGAASAGSDFGGGALPNAGGTDAVLVRYSPSGTYISGLSYGGPSDDAATAVAVDSSGNALLGGSFTNNIDFGSGGKLMGTGLELFLAKLGGNGSHNWSHGFSPISGMPNTIASVAAAPVSGNVVIAGGVSAAVDFGKGPVSNGGGEDAFAASFAP